MLVDLFLLLKRLKAIIFPADQSAEKCPSVLNPAGGKAKGPFQDVSRKIFGSFNLLLNNFWTACKQPSGFINTASRLLSGKRAQAIT